VPGRCFASRVCASLVRAAGLPELVVGSAEEYVALAVALGRDRARLAALRERLQATRATSMLFDTPGLVAALEGLFRRMWVDFLAGRLPVPDLTNLDVYQEVGAGLDHDAAEFGADGDPEAPYRRALAHRHAFQPLPCDTRLCRAAGAMPLQVAA